MRYDELTQPQWQDPADYFCESVVKYGMAAFQVPAIVQPQMNEVVAMPVTTTLGGLMETHHIGPRTLQMPRGTSRPGSRHLRLGSGKPQ